MDEPITDVVFVTDEKDTPAGYKVLTQCPDQHSANLWQKFLGAKTEIRYICYTKEDKDGMVVEDMYIPTSNERYIMKGYTVVKRTVTGEDSLNLKYLAIKKTPRHKAKRAMMDITVFRSKDKPAAIYKKLGAKLNGRYICIRLDTLKDKAASDSKKAGAPSSTSPPSSSSPLQTAPSSLPSPPPPQQPSPLPSTPPQTSPLPSTPPQAQPPSSSFPSQTPPPVTSVPDSSTYPVQLASTQATPPTTSTYDPEQFTSASPVTNVPTNTTAPSPPYDTASYSADPVVGPGNSGDHGGMASEVHTIALGFELLDLDQPIPESFQQLGDSPPDSDEEFSPSDFYQSGLTPPAPAIARSRTIGHGSSSTSAPSVQRRSGSMHGSSAHPPPGQGYPPPQPGIQGYPPQPGVQGYSPQPGVQGYSPQPGVQGYSSQPGSQGYPPQAASLGYPPPIGGQGYPPQPGNQSYPPPQPRLQGYPPQTAGPGYPFTNMARPLGSGYPSPAGFTGYNAGPAFGAAPVNPAPSGSRPFNPYEQSRPAPHGSQPGYPPTYPPTNTSYGFKI